MTDVTPISGLKLSEQLTSIWVHTPPRMENRLTRLCRLLTRQQINIAFLTSASLLDSRPVLCCIDVNDQPAVADLMDRNEDLKPHIRYGGCVGVITFYPHRSDLKLLGLALQLLGQNGIKVHGLASSIAALSFVVDFHRIDDAARAFAANLQLPDNASPLRSEFRIHQERRSL
jgi:aspartokinase